MNREILKQKAEAQVAYMDEHYGDLTEKSVNSSVIYNHDFKLGVKNGNKDTEFVVEDMDTVSAVMRYGIKNVSVLNFASYKNPGGGFLNGSKAQEESLCHESNLYNILRNFDKFYEWNRNNQNKLLYLNRGIFTPNVAFVRHSTCEQAYANVITVAAPNKAAAKKNYKVTSAENTKALSDRIRFILDIAVSANTYTIILGAFGCGVFGQDANEVASLFRTYLTTEFKGCFDTVVFAIPRGKDGNYVAFKNRFR